MPELGRWVLLKFVIIRRSIRYYAFVSPESSRTNGLAWNLGYMPFNRAPPQLAE